MFQKFQTKLVLLFALLFAAVQGVSYLSVQNTVRNNIFDQARDQLTRAYAVFEKNVEDTTTVLAEGSTILAKDFGFRQAVATNDRPTIMSAIDNLSTRIKADRVILVAPDNKIIGDTGTASDAAADGNIVTVGEANAVFQFPEMIAQADEEGRANSITVMDGQIYQTVVVPIGAPVTIASLVIGVEINTIYVATLAKKFTVPLDITFAKSPAEGEWIVGTSTLKPELAAGLGGALRTADTSATQVAKTLTLGGRDFVTLIASLPSPSSSAKIDAAIQYSLDASLIPFEPLFLTLLGLAGGTLLLTLIASFFIAGGVSKPIRVLDAAARRIQSGDYREKVNIDQKDEIGRLSQTFNQMMDGIAQREAKIEYQSLHDPSTELPNRLAFERRLNGAIAEAQKSNAALSVYLVQIGRFSEINNTLGHDTGEQLVAKIGDNLQRIIKQSDVVSRHSSSIFALLLPGAGSNQVNPIVERILDSFDEPLSVGGNAIDVTAWIGEACYPEHGITAKMLLQRADTAIFEAKKSSQHYALYNAQLDPYKPERLSMMGELRSGLDRGEFRLYYQPKIDIATEKITAAEALIRWIHPVRGFMPPDAFIPLAEQTGNIQKLTSWALDTAIAQVAAWKAKGIDIKVAINLSARDLSNRNLPHEIERVMAKHGATIDQLILEITESAVMEDPKQSMEVLSALNKMGAILSIDDYGTGYSSMSYLKSLPVQEIKIDKSFVMKLSSNKGDEILVRSTIDLGHNLGLKVTAEGVEDRAGLDILKTYGCETGQGYHISKPVPAADFEKFFLTSRWSPLPQSAAANA
ncbi:MAG: EAL domain-containing protein [Rhodospirillaceae bacterium]|nr:EAL domain-containing protein [Rhodospirillaceae bacterium]